MDESKTQLIASTPAVAVSPKTELAELREKLARLKREALPGKCPIRFLETNSEKIDWEHPILREPYESLDGALKYLTATTDSAIAEEIFTKGINALPGKNLPRKANVLLQALADISPHDATEARLCLQAAALYSQGMAYLCRAEINDTIPQCEFYMKNAMKLLRLHNETVEALNKYKRGGEQRVVVQHVNVERGAQAIVNNGNMVAGGGENKK